MELAGVPGAFAHRGRGVYNVHFSIVPKLQTLIAGLAQAAAHFYALAYREAGDLAALLVPSSIKALPVMARRPL